MYNPKVSIVIPVFNGHDFLREAIDSALAQTYANKEVLIVNDGSNDQGRTEGIALSYGDKIQYLSKENGGVASALNLAVEKMSGDFFSWLSHDDLYTPDKVAREVAAVAALGRGDVIIYSDYAVFSESSERAYPVRLRGVPPAHFRYWITVENQLHGCTLLIPRSAFAKVGGFDVSLRTTQDYDLWFRMASEFSFIHIPEVLVKARSHADQGSYKMADIALAECNALLSRFVTGLSPEEILAATEKSLDAAYSEIAESMFRRGFNEAGMVADGLANQNAPPSSSSILGQAVRQASRWRDRIYSMGRRVFPRQLKRALKSMLSPAAPVHRAENADQSRLNEKFTEVYEKNIFGGRISRSGEGSDLVQTEVIRQELPRIVQEYGVRSFLDAPCGDWYWMRQTNLCVEHYIGIDIVKPLIERNQREFANASTSFCCMNLAEGELPQVDLVFSRDCLVHLSFEDGLRIIANFKRSGSKYLLTTTFVNRDHNNDLTGKDSFWRPLNMQLSPFNFPSPLLLINEKCTEEGGQYADKCLGLWRLSDIR
jgi:hypothetical protein